MTYNANIERLKQASNYNTSLANQYETEHANRKGAQGITDARYIADGLSDFSTQLKEWRKKDIEKKKEEGKLEAQRYATADATKLAELAQEIKGLQEDDTRFHEIKSEMLKLSGPDVYPEADRLAKLSPWAQVGYAAEKLRVFNESFDDKLAYMMQNSDQAITIQGMRFTPRELRENNITGLPFKEAAVHAMSEQLKQESGIYNFSPELLALAGTNDAVQKAKDGQMEKFRERYNIDASGQTRAQAVAEWQRSEKTGADLQRLLLVQSATVDKSNQILGRTGAWNNVMNQLTTEGVSLGDPSYADVIGNLPIPADMAVQMGIKPGTTFKEQWPQRFNKLKSDIKAGYVTAVDAELKYQKAEGKQLEADFIKAARSKPLSAQEVNEWKRKFGDAGLPIPSGVTNYETRSDMDERESKDMIEAIMASQQGYISHEQLDQFNPKAALEYRDKATKMADKAVKMFGAEDKIKADLNTAFTNMGIKGNEKSPAWIEALENAKADYALKYHRYIDMGYTRAEASHHALHSQSVNDPESGRTLVDSQGVLHEIRQNGERSKYVITGQSVEKSLKAGHIRVAQISLAKNEILNDPHSVTTKVIGGDYGHRQITTIKNNIDKYGARGLYMDKGALQYYKGIARGRNAKEGGFWGIVDAQLKALGHEGLNPANRPAMLSITTGKDADGNLISDRRGHSVVNRRIASALQYPSPSNNLYILNMLQDEINYGQTPNSVWDQQQYLNPCLLGGVA